MEDNQQLNGSGGENIGNNQPDVPNPQGDNSPNGNWQNGNPQYYNPQQSGGNQYYYDNAPQKGMSQYRFKRAGD